MPGAKVVEVRIGRKSFASGGGERRLVLRDIAFSAHEGEVLALLAPSGAGKTTTLRIVLGLDKDFEGSVARHAARVGVVFQEPRLLPWLNVAENLRLVCARGLPSHRIGSLLAEVGLAGVEERYPRELSVGMARRVALARALVIDPALLVLDEPFVSVDPQVAAALLNVVSLRARRDGAAVLMTTHDMGQALALADRVLVLSGQPTTLSLDQAVPSRRDDAGRQASGTALRARFRFLCATAAPVDAGYTGSPKD